MSRIAVTQLFGMGLGTAALMSYISHKESIFQDRILYNIPGMSEGTYFRLEFKDRTLKLFRLADYNCDNLGEYLFNNWQFRDYVTVYGGQYITIDNRRYTFERAMTAHELFSGNRSVTLQNGDKYEDLDLFNAQK